MGVTITRAVSLQQKPLKEPMLREENTSYNLLIAGGLLWIIPRVKTPREINHGKRRGPRHLWVLFPTPYPDLHSKY
jgi:hypothetical protein